MAWQCKEVWVLIVLQSDYTFCQALKSGPEGDHHFVKSQSLQKSTQPALSLETDKLDKGGQRAPSIRSLDRMQAGLPSDLVQAFPDLLRTFLLPHLSLDQLVALRSTCRSVRNANVQQTSCQASFSALCNTQSTTGSQPKSDHAP